MWSLPRRRSGIGALLDANSWAIWDKRGSLIRSPLLFPLETLGTIPGRGAEPQSSKALLWEVFMFERKFSHNFCELLLCGPGHLGKIPDSHP